MSQEQKMLHHYTPEMVELAMNIWMRSSVSLIDIRNKEIEPNKPLENYRLPSSMLLYTHSTPATIMLNQVPYQTANYGLCHAGKGTLLSIYPLDASLQAYMILYKAEAAPFYQRGLRNMLDMSNPFTQLYGFSPANPLFFLDKLQRMHEHWNKQESTQQFYAKVLFYHTIHQLYMELKRGNIRYIEPDYVEWVKEYLDQHFAEQVSIEYLSEMLPLSRSLLGRLFRKRENSSLQQYLNSKRLEAAKAYLENTNATIQEIAHGCGFADELNLNRMFKKYMHMTPGEYRRKKIVEFTKNDVDNDSQYLYNEGGLNSLAKSYRDGESMMFGKFRSKEMVLASALTVMLLLSACTSNTAVSNGGVVNSTPTPTQQTAQSQGTASETASQTRTISTVLGDVEVPDKPMRVVVDYVIGDVVALGVVPLGVAKADEGGADTAFGDLITESINIESWDMEPEEIMALEPDLIILSFSQNPYEALSKVAPTIYVPYGEMTTEERIHFIGDVLNKQEEANAVWDAYVAKIEEAKLAFQNAGLSDATITIGIFTDKNSYIAGAKHALGVLVYNELQMQPPSKVQTDIIDADEYWGDISMELLPAYMGDYAISLGDMDITANNTVWQAIPAVQSNRIATVNTGLSWYTDIMSSSALIDSIVSQLLAMDK